MEEKEEVILTNEQVIEIAAEGYGDGLPSHEEALAGNSGDTLADFIVIELLEAGGGDAYECMRLMRQASEELEAIARAFEKRL